MNQKYIRNFCIIAHIDHGKSTLADRILELTHTVDPRDMKTQFLDSLELERERQITIKLSAVLIKYTRPNNENYFFNLIDTPGHVDFTYEVSRSLVACEGALLIIDAAQGIQAQTLSNAYLAMENNLTIIPVINKIDLSTADIDNVKQQMQELLNIDPSTAILISAKTGYNIPALLEAIVERIPSPPPDQDHLPLRAIVFDSYYDPYRGAVLYIKVQEGMIRNTDTILMMATQAKHSITELGVKTQNEQSCAQLTSGQVGWVAAGIKNLNEIKIGDTITVADHPASKPLPGYHELKPVVYCGLFPAETFKYKELKKALSKISLTDAALQYQPDSSEALGFGYRCGFLGLLHMEVIQERLEKEHNLELIATAPQVSYQIHLTNGHMMEVSNPAAWPVPQKIQTVTEPIVLIKIYTNDQYIGGLMKLCQNKRGIYRDLVYLGMNRHMLCYEMPLNEIIFNFFNKLKSISQGYASFEYEFLENRPSKLVKMDILLNGQIVDALSCIVHTSAAYQRGRELCLKLKDLIPRENFEVPIQAAINAKIIARETIKATRKNVTAGLYGGDISRKKKVLARQKKGKKHLKLVGKVHVPQEAFLSVLKLEK